MLRLKWILFFTALVIFAGCSGQKAYDNGVAPYSTPTPEPTYSGYVLVASVMTENSDGPVSGPGWVSLFDPQGNFVRKIADYTGQTAFPVGLAYTGSGNVLIALDGTDRIESHNLNTSVTTSFGPLVGLSGNPIRDLARRTVDGSLFISEWTNTHNVERYDSLGNRQQAPYIASTVGGTCNLNGPYGMAYIPGYDRLAVISHPAGATSGRLSVYDVSDPANPACVNYVTAAPFNANTPTAVAYHALTNRILVTLSTGNLVAACQVSGTGCSTIINTPVLVSNPRAITTDGNGYIYVASVDTHTIERFTWSGSGAAVRNPAGNAFIGPRSETINPTAILVIP